MFGTAGMQMAVLAIPSYFSSIANFNRKAAQHTEQQSFRFLGISRSLGVVIVHLEIGV